MRIYVGNLSYRTTSQELIDFFAQIGQVQDAVLAMDRETQRSKGFGFIEMANSEEAYTAIQQLNGSELSGRKLIVARAFERHERNQQQPWRNGQGARQERRSYQQ